MVTCGTATGHLGGVAADVKLTTCLQGRPFEDLGYGDYQYIELIRLLGQQPSSLNLVERNEWNFDASFN
eukprot:7622166-Prorocentrum_lima.AAC.1